MELIDKINLALMIILALMFMIGVIASIILCAQGEQRDTGEVMQEAYAGPPAVVTQDENYRRPA